MYETGRKKGSVSFKVRTNGNVSKVAVAGDFNGWKPIAMRKLKDGSFVVTVDVAPGRYEYKYVLDGKWIHDPDVPGVITNSFGTLNSVVFVK